MNVGPFSPIKIETLLHVYHLPEPLWDAHGVTEALGEFLRDGLIELDEREGSGYRCTPVGRELVDHWCKPVELMGSDPYAYLGISRESCVKVWHLPEFWDTSRDTRDLYELGKESEVDDPRRRRDEGP